nr:T9SS type A sorting domain-containing protein [Parabacteroides goldsteinii]
MKKILTLVTLLLGIYCAQAQTNAGLPASKNLSDPVMFFSDAGPQVKTKADASSFAGGSGTAADPYLIATKEHLSSLETLAMDDSGDWPIILADVHFKQIADIVYEDGEDMPRIGKGAWFAGTYDGDGYAIKNYNVKLNRVYEDEGNHNVATALFNNSKRAILKNIRMVGTKINIEGKAVSIQWAVGGLAANFQEGQIVNCTTEGTYSVRITGKDALCSAGGLVAKAFDSTIDNCRSYGSICSEVVSTGGSSTAETSGIVGVMEDGTKVINCISYSKMESYGSGDADQLIAYVGGITSYARGSSQILNCGSRGELLIAKVENKQQGGTSYTYTAGLVPILLGKSILLNGWSVVPTLKGQAATGSYVYPVCCTAVEESTFENCYYLLENEESEAAMKSQKFVDKLNENLPEDALTWQFRKDDYPALQALHNVTLPLLTGATTTPGEGVSAIEEGERFRFSLALEEEYNQSKPIVTIGDKTLEPDDNMNYVTEPVTADMVVKIDGIVKNTETANEDINASIQKVYAADGILYIQPEATAQVNVFNMQGQLVKSTLVSSEAQIQLPQGLYIVRLNDQSYKVLISE